MKLNDITVIGRADTKKVISAAALGNAVKWFDFGVYSFMAFVSGKIFLPDASLSVQTTAAPDTFPVPFIFRSLGGLVFGALGGRIGRQRISTTAITVMPLSTFGIDLISSYDSIGIWSPTALLLLKITQGFSVGRGYAGASIFVAEYSPDHKHGPMTSWLGFGSTLGLLLGAGAVSAFHLLLGDSKFMEWGWRIPFFLVLPLGVIGLCLRHVLDETPVFQEHTVDMPCGEKNKTSLHDLFRKHKRSFLICSGIVLTTNATYYMLLIYLPNHFSHNLGYPENHGILTIITAMIEVLLVQPLISWLSDKYGRRPLILIGSLSLLFSSWPSFYLLAAGEPVLIFFSLLVLALSLNMLISMMAATLPTLFPTSIRYSDLTVVSSISIVLTDLTPIITSFLVGITHNLHISAFYLMVFGLLDLIAAKPMHKPANKSLTGGKPPASDKAGTKELLVKYHDRTGESIETIDERAKESQHKREVLVAQHPHID